MKASAAWALRALLLAALAAGGAWLVRHTEWVEERIPLPLTPELQRDGAHVARAWLQRLGMKVVQASDLSALPPRGATLVLSTALWNAVPGTSDRLQRWVDEGGHLVLDGSALLQDEQANWLPLRWDTSMPAARDAEYRLQRRDWCRLLEPRAGLPPAWGSDSGFVACLRAEGRLAMPQAPLLWALDSSEIGAEALRVAFGRGRVTAFGAHFLFDSQGPREPLRNFSNRGLLEGDNAPLLAALVDAQPGGEVWFVTALDRPPLPQWLWQHAQPVLLLAAAALLLWLWRAGTRFGPLQTPPPPTRRSLAAQVRGLADFLFRHQPAALHAAALRALEEAAAARIAGWRRLAAPARAAALARATRLPEARIAAALEPAAPRNALAWSEALALIETLRRALTEPRRP